MAVELAEAIKHLCSKAQGYDILLDGMQKIQKAKTHSQIRRIAKQTVKKAKVKSPKKVSNKELLATEGWTKFSQVINS